MKSTARQGAPLKLRAPSVASKPAAHIGAGEAPQLRANIWVRVAADVSAIDGHDVRIGRAVAEIRVVPRSGAITRIRYLRDGRRRREHGDDQRGEDSGHWCIPSNAPTYTYVGTGARKERQRKCCRRMAEP